MALHIAGSINVDLIQAVSTLPKPGETILAQSSTRLPGGKGANQAVAAARMGAATRFTGAVGADESGEWMCGILAQEGIDIADISKIAEGDTGLAVIAVDKAGENQIIVNSGANGTVSISGAFSHSDDSTVLLAQLEIPVESVRGFFSSGDGKLRILNAAPAMPHAASLFEDTDILIVNQHELAEYLGLDRAPADAEEALAARKLIRRDDQLVIVTLGSGGALAVWSDSHFHAPAQTVTPLDTIGAGDCFCGALAAFLDAGESVESALPLANAAAALCTQKPGAIPAMPTRQELDRFLAG